jgi:NAD-reducing hydrogenase small subunit
MSGVPNQAVIERKTLATVWLDGCSGCHMSLLDMDERLIELSSQFRLVYSPLVDRKTFPETVDVTLVEGAVASEEDLRKIRRIREHSRILVSLGDCALTGNVSAMRNAFGPQAVLARVYEQNAAVRKQIPVVGVPALLDRVRPVHEVVPVDVFVPGCPPSADTIYQVLSELLAGKVPTLEGVAHFG